MVDNLTVVTEEADCTEKEKALIQIYRIRAFLKIGVMKLVQALKQMVYQAFGFTISSEMKLPELIQIEESKSPLDIIIKYEHIADEWNCAEEKEKGYWIQDNRVLFEIDQVAIFAVDSGKTISISPHLDSDEDEIRL